MTHPAGETEGVRAPRYDFDAVDLESGSTHADVVLQVGEGKHVLELGTATGYMSRALAGRGCTVVGVELDAGMARRAAEHVERMIVGDLETLDLEAELGDERFDVIVAADLLEHLRDPLVLLRRLTPFLADDGAVVLSVPNVAHGSVRLALLDGRFDYQQKGLLDRTHATFFTRRSLEQLLDEAELGIAALNRHELELGASEVQFDAAAIPEELRRRLDADPDARTYQFVIKAIPMGRSGLRELQRRLRDQARALSDVERERDELRFVAARAEELSAALAQIAGREGELRRSLVEGHDQLLRKDAELEELRGDLEALRDERERLEELRRGDRDWIDEQAAALAQADVELRLLRGRLAYKRLARLFRRALREVRASRSRS